MQLSPVAQQDLFITDRVSGMSPSITLVPPRLLCWSQALDSVCWMLTTVSAMPVLLLQVHNPFVFKHVEVLGGGKQFHDTDPCVMLATPSMLQSGFSRDLFEAWAGDRNNTVLIVDFAVQGTLARQLLDSPQTVTTRDNRPVRKALRKLLRHGYCLPFAHYHIVWTTESPSASPRWLCCAVSWSPSAALEG